MNYYNEIKEQIVNNEITKRVKDYSKNKSDLNTYYNVGKLLSKAGKHYGEGIIKEYSIRLSKDLGKKYSMTSLKYIRRFYEFSKSHSLSDRLTYTHYKMLLSLKNKNNYQIISEKILQKLILEDIPSFLEELGSGFTFIKNEYKIKLGNTYNYIDLLLYNIKYKCYVVIELKIAELKKEHIGQIQTYMNYIDKNIKTIEEDKTIGIIICKRNNKYIIEYCSDDRIIAKEYELV